MQYLSIAKNRMLTPPHRSILTTLGLRPSTQPISSLAPSLLIFQWLHAYIVLSSRTLKQIHGFDNNISPRDDVTKYGQEMIKKGKITQRDLDRVRRMEAAQANSIESFGLLGVSSLLAMHAGVNTGTVNGLMAVYVLARVGYSLAYVLVETRSLSYIRSLMFWIGNISCVTMMVLAGKRL
jgi:uncharacterized MAPEG superfamily protein